MQIAAMGAMTSMARQDILTNNLANLNTAGFKPAQAFTMLRDAARVEDGLSSLPSDKMLERLGGGVHLAPVRFRYQQGPIERSSNPFDVAIEGDGFFVVRAGGETAGEELRLSRDGRLTRNDAGELVRVADGLPVLDGAGRTIRIPDAESIVIDRDGVIRANGEPVGRLELVDVPDRMQLTPEEGGLLRPTAEAWSNRVEGTGGVRQFAVEGSAVNEFTALMEMTGAGRSAQANLGMIGYHDQLLNSAINRFGRLS